MSCLLYPLISSLNLAQVAQKAMGLLTTESRKVWSHLREELIKSNKNNANCLTVVESALFVVCLDDDGPEALADLCGNFLCGGYKLEGGVQVGTCGYLASFLTVLSQIDPFQAQIDGTISCKSLSAIMARLASTLSILAWTVTRSYDTQQMYTPSSFSYSRR